MTQPATNAVLLEMLKQLREDIAEDRLARRSDDEAARQSRTATHTRIDEVIDRLGRLDVTVALAGQVDAQVRTELDGLRSGLAAQKAEITPTIDEWKRIRTLGLGIVGLMAFGGASVGAAIVWGGNAMVDAIRAWLRIH